jgi:hypothetical protein
LHEETTHASTADIDPVEGAQISLAC